MRSGASVGCTYGLRAPSACQPPALGTYRRRRAASPQGPTYRTYCLRVPASGVRYGPRTLAPQVEDIESNVQRVLQWMQQWAADHQ